VATNQTRRLALTIPDDAWQETGESHPASRLLACLDVTLGAAVASLFVEAYEVRDELGSDGSPLGLVATDALFSDEVELLYTLHPDSALQEVTIRGRRYILCAFPVSP
jgi:hypothetical protein